MLAINPDECIECALCVPECPVDAIVSEDEVDSEPVDYLELNARLSEKWPNITAAKQAPEDAKKWEGVKQKLHLLEE